MKILAIDEQAPLADIPCVVPRARGATAEARVPVLGGRIDRLPGGLAGLVLASDLQAREAGGDNRPIGVVVAEEIERLARTRGLAPTEVGVILAGDLHTSESLHRRFGVGDVSAVWDAFAHHFRWVTGVLGNVDRLPRKARKRHSLLEGTLVRLDDLCIAGVSGIIGSSKMENRRQESVFLRELSRLVERRPDILVLHEGPSIPGLGLPGNDAVRQALREFTGLVVCGHNPWPRPLAPLRRARVLNTDGRCVLLTC